jgi:NAD(P)H-hydrate repair Nnr-like enzyme with NAD(P)H-hydrate epimerase domain
MTEILTSAEMRAAEATLFAAGLPPFDLMRRAGLAAADAIQARHPTALRFSVLCGPTSSRSCRVTRSKATRRGQLPSGQVT